MRFKMNTKNLLVYLLCISFFISLLSSVGLATIVSREDFKNIDLSTLTYSDFTFKEGNYGTLFLWTQESYGLVRHNTSSLVNNKTVYSYYTNIETINPVGSYFLQNSEKIYKEASYEDCFNKYSSEVCNQAVQDFVVVKQELWKNKTIKDLKQYQASVKGISQVSLMSSFNNFKTALLGRLGKIK